MPRSVTSRSKDEWRAQFRSYRRSLSPSTYAAKSTLACTRASALPCVARASVIHVYWPLPQQGELDTRPLIRTLRARDATVVLPVVTSYDPAAPTMEHRQYEGPSALTSNRWGIREPTETPLVPVDALDAVIVPALGGDEQGNRIGHGSGYYDAFLSSVDVPRILLIYDDCFVPSLPSDPHDVPVTSVVTERGVTSLPTNLSSSDHKSSWTHD